MAAQSRFFIKLHASAPERTTTIFSHFGHANYTTSLALSSNGFSMGYHLRQWYGEEYVCLGLGSAEGTLLSFDDVEYRFVEKGFACDDQSVESLLATSADSFFYVDTHDWNTLMRMSFFGSSERRDPFFTIAPGLRMDGLFFIRKSSPAYKPREVLDVKLKEPMGEVSAWYLETSKRYREKKK